MDHSSTPLKSMKAIVQTEMGGPDTFKVGDVPFPVMSALMSRNLKKEKLLSKYSTQGLTEQTLYNAREPILHHQERPIL